MSRAPGDPGPLRSASHAPGPQARPGGDGVLLWRRLRERDGPLHRGLLLGMQGGAASPLPPPRNPPPPSVRSDAHALGCRLLGLGPRAPPGHRGVELRLRAVALHVRAGVGWGQQSCQHAGPGSTYPSTTRNAPLHAPTLLPPSPRAGSLGPRAGRTAPPTCSPRTPTGSRRSSSGMLWEGGEIRETPRAMGHRCPLADAAGSSSAAASFTRSSTARRRRRAPSTHTCGARQTRRRAGAGASCSRG